MSDLDETLLSISVSKTDRGRDYWASSLKLEGDELKEVRGADVLIVPWEDFRPGTPRLFPQGATDFINVLRADGRVTVALAADRATYAEIALHADEWRLPTVFCSVVALPIFLNILSNHVDQWLFANPATTIVEEELIVSSADRRCFAIKYKGPPVDLVETFRSQAEACMSPKAAQSHIKEHLSHHHGPSFQSPKGGKS